MKRLMNRTKNNNGFTLAEVLIVVAIVAVLVGVSIPIFNSQLEKSRRAVDMSNARSAYGAAITQNILDDNGQKMTYYYTGSTVISDRGSLASVTGYGQSSKSIEQELIDNGFKVAVKGVPKKNGSPCLLRIDMIGGEVTEMAWISYPVVMDASTWTAMNSTAEGKAQLLQNDINLVTSIQDVAKSMSYKDLSTLLAKDCYKENYRGGTVYTLAISDIDPATGSPNMSTINSGDAKYFKEGQTTSRNHIFANELLTAAGYDTSRPDSELYLMTSKDYERSGNYSDSMKIKLYVKKGSSDNDPPAEAFIYINGGGYKTLGNGTFGFNRTDNK